jgi:succinoglycan biosynthesis protein ExoU
VIVPAPDDVTADRSVAVIITARDAAATVAKAVASALAQLEAREVVLVDDGSRDATAAVAASVDDGSGRLKIIRLDENRGPSHGRNVAIAASSAPFLCILDADDFMTPGRLGRLFDRGGEDWDLLADDLLFCDGPDEARVFDRLLPPGSATPRDLTLSAFALGNLPRRDRPRRELGFLKPLIRRAFVEWHGIRYDERLRLGEDFVFYASCLIVGARFRLVESCGYCAVQYANSLSGRHRTEDIARFYEAQGEIAREAARRGLDADELGLCLRATRDNLALRRALDWRRERGWRGFASALGASPASLPYIIARIARDKLGVLSGRLAKARA